MSDHDKSRLFYEQAFSPLGYRPSFGKESVFWAFDVGNGCLFEIQSTDEKPPLTHLHVAFRAKSNPRSMRSIGQHSRPVRKTMARPARVRIMRRITTPASCSIPMATTSRR